MELVDKNNKDKVDLRKLHNLKLMEVKEVVKFDDGDSITVYQDAKDKDKAMDVFGGEE